LTAETAAGTRWHLESAPAAVPNVELVRHSDLTTGLVRLRTVQRYGIAAESRLRLIQAALRHHSSVAAATVQIARREQRLQRFLREMQDDL
jgi:hypothetical protein